MSRPSRPKPAPKPAPQAAAEAPKPEAQVATADASQAAADPAGKTESTLGDGDATGAAQEALSATAAPPAPTPDVVTVPDEDHSQKRGPEGYAVQVTGPAKGRWRIGRKFGPEPVSIPAQELTEPELRAIDEDPELRLKLVPIEA